MKRIWKWAVKPRFSWLALIIIGLVAASWNQFADARHWSGWTGTLILTGGCAFLLAVAWLIPPRGFRKPGQ